MQRARKIGSEGARIGLTASWTRSRATSLLPISLRRLARLCNDKAGSDLKKLMLYAESLRMTLCAMCTAVELRLLGQGRCLRGLLLSEPGNRWYVFSSRRIDRDQLKECYGFDACARFFRGLP